MTNKQKTILTLLAIALLILAGTHLHIMDLSFTLFEDGSIKLTGCLPFSLCQY